MGSEDIILMKPVFNHNIWGGTKLRDEYGFDIEGNDIGECWGIAAHPNGDAAVACGRYEGMKLSRLWKEHGELFGNTDEKPFPLLIKIIDAEDDLSIQVHPDDEYAREHENGSLGKNECWYVISAKPGASLVIGHNAKTREELCSMIDERRFKDLIREVPVSAGDFVQIDAGTIHAIKGGIVLLEIQQSSDITYRVYDYDRLSGGRLRELHIEKSKDVITVPSPDAEKMVIHDGLSLEETRGYDERLLTDNRYYNVRRLSVNGEHILKGGDTYRLMTVIEGSGSVGEKQVSKGSFFIIPVNSGDLKLTGKMRLVCASV